MHFEHTDWEWTGNNWRCEWRLGINPLAIRWQYDLVFKTWDSQKQEPVAEIWGPWYILVGQFLFCKQEIDHIRHISTLFTCITCNYFTHCILMSIKKKIIMGGVEKKDREGGQGRGKLGSPVQLHSPSSSFTGPDQETQILLPTWFSLTSASRFLW